MVSSCVRVAYKPFIIWLKSAFSSAPVYVPVVQSSGDFLVFLNPLYLPSPYWFTLLPPSEMPLFAIPGSDISPRVQRCVHLPPLWSIWSVWPVSDMVWLLNKCSFSSSIFIPFSQCIILDQNNFFFFSTWYFYSSSNNHPPKLFSFIDIFLLLD